MHSLAVCEQGTSVQAEGDLLLLARGASVVKRVRAGELDQVLLLGRVELTSGAIGLLLRRGIDVVWLTQNGVFRGRLAGRQTKNVLLRLAQYRRTADAEFCLATARAVVASKVRHQRQLLLRAQRRLRDADLAVVLGQLRGLAERTAAAGSLDTLRGLEGQGAHLYFGQFRKLLRNEQFSFGGRSRRPPRDEINALLSFGYAVLGSLLESEVYRSGLDPLLGFFHQPAYGRPSLMLDLLEEFRPLVDTLVLRVVNRRQLGAADFVRRSGRELADLLGDSSGGEEPSGAEPVPWEEAAFGGPAGELPADPASGRTDEPSAADRRATESARSDGEAVSSAAAGAGSKVTGAPELGVYLGDVGRKIFLNELFRRLRERQFYPAREATLDLRAIVREQVYHMARVIKSRDESYIPYVPA